MNDWMGRSGSSGSRTRCWVVLTSLLLLAARPVSFSGGPLEPSDPGGGEPQTRSGQDDAAARVAAAAQAALRAGDYPKAIESLKQLVKMAPGVGEIRANLATAYYSAGRYDDAAQQAREALKLKPSLTNAHFFLGLSLAESGRCQEALPYLEKDYGRAPEVSMKRALGVDALRCAMSVNDSDQALSLVRSLDRDFSGDPDVLYLSSHIYSSLSTRASQRLLVTAPESYQAHQLNAEVLAIQGKLSEAAAEYRTVLSLNPHLAGIHYELGELLLSGERGPNTLDEAQREFEEELKIDPRSATAEYELGEMARQGRQWNEAIQHFQRAVTLDPQFAEALIGLGKSLVSAGRPQEAVAPLERSVELDPGNANGHYQLSFAYRRLGREEDAGKELAAYREIHDNLQKTQLRIRTGILGNLSQPQTDTPPD
ncbi:MAG TPA: tetratricopeptide repeat protein [Terriglobia bacterium]|nr:tetratricopeptide repeat protein [Terriglobia bacterium]